MKRSLLTSDTKRAGATDERGELPVIFGLRYLEEEAGEIHDIVGCMIRQEDPSEPRATASGCDDTD